MLRRSGAAVIDLRQKPGLAAGFFVLALTMPIARSAPAKTSVVIPDKPRSGADPESIEGLRALR
ncbi:hypothetical protein [uncultured Bosea sp.]|uniref:hypothetical protein n=1 Tax=uncultured Bosea sp. TaxID=211457 RepID=UPI00263A65C2|nr:hypothetical protein [uncultured Bosea sp.]